MYSKNSQLINPNLISIFINPIDDNHMSQFEHVRKCAYGNVFDTWLITVRLEVIIQTKVIWSSHNLLFTILPSLHKFKLIRNITSQNIPVPHRSQPNPLNTCPRIATVHRATDCIHVQWLLQVTYRGKLRAKAIPCSVHTIAEGHCQCIPRSRQNSGSVSFKYLFFI